METVNCKRNIIFLALFLLLPLLVMSPARGDEMEIVRLHVIANSNSEIDQYVKLRVRDAVLEASSSLLLTENAAEKIKNNLTLFEDAAKVVLASYDMDYSAQAQFGEFDFPTKSYGNITLPAGKYTATRIILGEGTGQNWWCVMYPPLCFTTDAVANFPDNTVDILSKNGLPISDRPKFKIKFKIAELFK